MGWLRRVFVIVAVALWLFVSVQLKAEQEQFAQFHAQFVTRSILDHEIGPTDLDSPMTGARADELRQTVKSRILVYPVVALRIWSRNGTILFSANPALVGVQDTDPTVATALGGGTSTVLQSSHQGINSQDLPHLIRSRACPGAGAAEVSCQLRRRTPVPPRRL